MLSIRCNSHAKSLRSQKDPQRITKIKSYRNRYDWEVINYLSKKEEKKRKKKNDWQKIEKINLIIALTVLHSKKDKIYRANVLKYNSNSQKNVILLMI